MATVAEIDETVRTIRENGCDDIILLKCTSTYPALPKNSNILTIPHMQKLFSCKVGLSDHTLGIGAAIAAVAHGACVIEKHFTIDRNDGGVDSSFSMNPSEMKSLVDETKRAKDSLGSIFYGATQDEENSKIFRRSLYISKDMKEGEIFNKDNLRSVRPGKGLPPKYYSILLGKKIKKKTVKKVLH